MNEKRKDIALLIEKIRKDYDIIDNLSSIQFERIAAEMAAHNKRIEEISRHVTPQVDYLVKYRDEFNKLNTIAIEAKRSFAAINVNQIQGYLERIKPLNIDKAIFITNSKFTESARKLAEQHSKSFELIDTERFKNLIEIYHTQNIEFSTKLAESIRQLNLRELTSFHGISADEIDEIEPENIILPDEHKSNLIKVDGLPLKAISTILRDPKELHNLSPGQFEEFIADILSKLGFKNIVLTPRSSDGGKDVIASNKVNGIPMSFYFECKKYAKGNKIQLNTLRAPLGTVAHSSNETNIGVLVTTSTFTKGCRDLILSECRLDGKDYDGILGWIDEINKNL